MGLQEQEQVLVLVLVLVQTVERCRLRARHPG